MGSVLFSPIRLAGLTLDNRIVVVAHVPVQRRRRLRQRLAPDPSRHAGQFGRRPGGDRGDPCGAARPHHPWLPRPLFGRLRGEPQARDRSLPPHRRLRLGIQLAHAGRKASSQRPWEGGKALPPGEDPWETLAPSALPFGPGWHTPRAMTEDDIAQVCAAFAAAAARAVRIGFDAIELHLAHGYLAHSFLSPISNRRTDRYGGSLDNRMRFSLETMEAVRHAVPAAIPLGARITGSDWTEGGITPQDAAVFAKALKAAGCDYVDVSSGGVTAQTRNPAGLGYNVPLAEIVRRESGLPTRTVGLIVTPEQAEADRRRRQGRHDGACPRDPRQSALALARRGGARRRGEAAAAISARRAGAVVGRGGGARGGASSTILSPPPSGEG